MTLPSLDVLSVKIPVSDLAASRSWYARVFGLSEEMEWPDGDGVVRGVGFAGLGSVTLALRGRLVGFHDPDGHELSFYAGTHQEGVRSEAVRSVRVAGQGGSAPVPAPAEAPGGLRS